LYIPVIAKTYTRDLCNWNVNKRMLQIKIQKYIQTSNPIFLHVPGKKFSPIKNSFSVVWWKKVYVSTNECWQLYIKLTTYKIQKEKIQTHSMSLT